MSTARMAHPITVEQYEGFQGFPGLRDELIFGEIVMSPHAKPLHQEIARKVDDILRDLLKKTAYQTVRESNLKFAKLHSMPSPDVYVTTRKALKDACENDVYISEPPVLAVEVLSPANRPKRNVQKIEIYLTMGVQAVWTLHPKKKTLVIHTATQETVLQTKDEIPNLPSPCPAWNKKVVVDDLFNLEI